MTDQHGAPDALVLNAGITLNALFAMTSDREWDEVIATNLGGLLAVGRPVVKAMVRARAGRIVLVSSIASQVGNTGQVAYAASKGALNSAALSLARELASRGITVNVVVPGSHRDRDAPGGAPGEAASADSRRPAGSSVGGGPRDPVPLQRGVGLL